jgi:hypothetical protein
MLAQSTLFTHFWHFYFVPVGEPWWRGAVWGNVIAIIPSAPVLLLLGTVGYFFHKRALDPLHAKIDALETLHAQRHADHLKLLSTVLDAFDPDTDGGIAEVLDRLDPDTPGGIGALAERLKSFDREDPPDA